MHNHLKIIGYENIFCFTFPHTKVGSGACSSKNKYRSGLQKEQSTMLHDSTSQEYQCTPCCEALEFYYASLFDTNPRRNSLLTRKKNVAFVRRYLPNNRRGSCANLHAHSKPLVLVQRGARFFAPLITSIAFPHIMTSRDEILSANR